MMHKSQLCDIAEEIYCRSSLWNEFNILYKKAKVQKFYVYEAFVAIGWHCGWAKL